MSSESLAASVRHVSKSYKLGLSGRTTPIHRIAAERLRHPFTPHAARRQTFRALHDISFDVTRGEVVGIIGRNGAGKSTLLKILTRITAPDAGEIDLYGRVGSLLEVGTGFHPELTGRENIYLNGAILGMKRHEIDGRLEAIIDFADVTTFLDTPVKRYSSGMRVRLAFSVAAHLEPELLLVDEVLAVGDANFQRKCLAKLREIATEDGRTVLFVSHNLVSVESLCSRTLFLDDGEIRFDGDSAEAISRYLVVSDHAVSVAPGEYDLCHRRPVQGRSELLLRRLTVRREDGEPTDAVRMGTGLVLELETHGLAAHPDAIVQLEVKSEMDRVVFAMTTLMKPLEARGDRADDEVIRIHLPRLQLTPGRFEIDARVRHAHGPLLDRVPVAGEFSVAPADVFGTGYHSRAADGLVFADWSWHLAARDRVILGDADHGVTGQPA